MPHIMTGTNISIPADARQKLAESYGSAITLLGKSESWLMLSFCDNTPMYFRGDDAPCAYLEIGLFGKASDSAYDDLTARLTQIITSLLPIPADRIYIKYSETSHWGWNGGNF